MSPDAMLTFLGRVTDPLSSYLEHIVVIGGFAPVLYRFHPEMTHAADPPTTLDLDIAVPGGLDVVGGRSICAHLKAAGFQERMTGSDPPGSEFTPPRSWGQGLSIEILTPLHGPETDRAGKTRKVVTLQGGEHEGFNATRLRWIDLLLDEPWIVTHGEVAAIPQGVALRVAHPAAYLAQKILSSAESTRGSKAKKDHANCYIVVAMSRDRVALARETVRRLSGSRAHRRWLKTLVGLASQLFAKQTGVGCLNAQAVLGVPPERVSQALQPYVKTLADAEKALSTPTRGS